MSRHPLTFAATAGLLAWPGASWACAGCAPLVRAYLFERGDFLFNLMLVMLPIVAIVGVAAALAGFDADA